MTNQSGWISVAEIIARFQVTEAQVHTLALAHHWPRVDGASGTSFGVSIRFGKAEAAIADLVRSHHWPRVYAGGAVLVGVSLDVIERALSGSAATIHGSVPAR